MSTPQSRIRSAAPGGRASLYWGASLATLIAAIGAGMAQAQSMGALLAATHQANVLASAAANPTAGAGGAVSSAAMLTAAANALAHQGQVSTAQTLAAQAQAAALASVKQLEQTDPLALNKTYGVVDGLGAGGLQPAVTSIVTAAGDATAGLTAEQASGFISKLGCPHIPRRESDGAVRRTPQHPWCRTGTYSLKRR